MHAGHDAPTLSYFVSKPYVAFWVCLVASAVYLLGRMIYGSPELVFIFGPFVLLLLPMGWPMLRDLARLEPNLVVTSDRIFYGDWPFNEMDLKNVKEARVTLLTSAGAARIHLEVINEKELLNTYGFISKLFLRMHRVSGDAPIVINLATLRNAKSQEVLEAINSRIAGAKGNV